MSVSLVETTQSFGSMMEQAEVLARSNLVPKAFRGKPADVIVATLLGRELGLGPMATMSYVDVIEGNATLNAEGKVALVRKQGHSIGGTATATSATAIGRRRDTGDEITVEWTIQMASRAGLSTKAVWRQFPEAMLWSRAVSQLCRMLFSDVLAGLSYTPEEVEAFAGPDATHTLPPNAALATGNGDSPRHADPETGEVFSVTTTTGSRRRPPPVIAPEPEPLPGDAPIDAFDVAAFRNAVAALPEPLRERCRAALAEHGWSKPAAISVTDVDEAWDLVRSHEPPSESQVRKLHAAGNAIGLDHEDLHGYASATLGFQMESLAELTKKEMSALIDAAEAEARHARKTDAGRPFTDETGETT